MGFTMGSGCEPYRCKLGEAHGFVTAKPAAKSCAVEDFSLAVRSLAEDVQHISNRQQRADCVHHRRLVYTVRGHCQVFQRIPFDLDRNLPRCACNAHAINKQIT
jgi:hypothetical protein